MTSIDHPAGESTGVGRVQDPAAEVPPVTSRRAVPVTPGRPATSPPGVAGGNNRETRPAVSLPDSGLPQESGSSSPPLVPGPREAAGMLVPETGATPASRVAPVRGKAPRTPAGGVGASPASPAGSHAYLAAFQASRMSEAELEENIRDACKKFGIIRFHVRFSLGTTPGLPDDILIGPGGILWRECKNQKKKPTPEQVKTGEALTAIGQDFAIWRPEDWFSGRIKRELLAISRMPVVRVSRQSPVTFAPPETLDGAS